MKKIILVAFLAAVFLFPVSMSADFIKTTTDCLQEHNIANLPVIAMSESEFNQLIACLPNNQAGIELD